MRSKVITLIAILSLQFSFAQDVFGKWKTVDDITGETKSIVEIYKHEGKVFGKVLEILNKEHKDDRCTECEGENKNRRIEGLVIIKNLEKDDDEYNDGSIMDPENGKEYKCYILLEEINKLKVRGYIGFAALGRTQYWYRVE